MKKKIKALTYYNNIIILLSFIICSLYTIKYFNDKDYLLSITSAVVGIIPLSTYIIDKFTRGKSTLYMKTAVLTFYYFCAVLGTVGNYYEFISFYDILTHFLSGVLFTWILIEFYKSLLKVKDERSSIMLLFVNCFNATIAVFWEILEFCLDFVVKRHFQKGLMDTMTDMIVAIVGGILVTIIYTYMNKRTTRK